MITPSATEVIESFIAKLGIIWGFILGGIIASAAITWLNLIDISSYWQSDGATATLITIILTGVALLDGVGAFVFDFFYKHPRWITRFLRDKIDLDGEDASNDDLIATVLLQYYFTLCIIRWSMVGGLAIYGIILGATVDAVRVANALYIGSALFLLLLKPKLAELEEMVRSVRK